MKNIIKAIAFLLIFAALFVKVSYALRPHGGSYLNIQTYGMQPQDTLDMVYVGGSSCFTYWLPMEAWEQHGFTSFNFSNNSLPAQMEKHCIVEALKKQSPELLVVDVRPFDSGDRIDEDGKTLLMHRGPTIRNFTDTIWYSFNRMKMIQDGVPDDYDRLEYHIDLMKYHTNFQVLLLKNQWKYAFNIPDDASKAFGGSTRLIRYAAIAAPDNSAVTEEQQLSEILDPIYLDLVAYCKSLEMNVLFIIPPYQEPSSFEPKHNYMQRIAEQNGISFLDCNDIFDEVGLNVMTDYNDVSHTNVFGAKKYTEWLGQYLKARYDLPDKRGEDKYADWDVAHEMWITESEFRVQETLKLMPPEEQQIALESIK